HTHTHTHTHISDKITFSTAPETEVCFDTRYRFVLAHFRRQGHSNTVTCCFSGTVVTRPMKDLKKRLYNTHHRGEDLLFKISGGVCVCVCVCVCVWSWSWSWSGGSEWVAMRASLG